VSPPSLMVKKLAEAVDAKGANKKLNKKRDSMLTDFDNGVSVGVAIEVDGELRVARIKDCLTKSVSEIGEDIKNFAGMGGKLPLEDQDLSDVCYVVSTMGKQATDNVIAVLPKGCTGIFGIGKLNGATGECDFSATLCHATLTGLEGAAMVREYKTLIESA